MSKCEICSFETFSDLVRKYDIYEAIGYPYLGDNSIRDAYKRVTLDYSDIVLLIPFDVDLSPNQEVILPLGLVISKEDFDYTNTLYEEDGVKFNIFLEDSNLLLKIINNNKYTDLKNEMKIFFS